MINFYHTIKFAINISLYINYNIPNINMQLIYHYIYLMYINISTIYINIQLIIRYIKIVH